MDVQFQNYASYEEAATLKKNTVTMNGVRFSVLTPFLLRVERQSSSVFCDLPTQAVICRRFDEPAFTFEKSAEGIVIKTDSTVFSYSFKKNKMTSVTLENGSAVTDFKSGNLKGTRRTLDQTYGPAALEDGVLSKNGVAVLDDSRSLIIDQSGRIVPRKVEGTDEYYFAYGRRYIEAVKDYFRLTGFPPLIPRFTLGNWWSRYKAYTDEEYKQLMQRFIDEKIPITVATIDMDWHWVNVVERFGKESREQNMGWGPQELFFSLASPGWTGYSWNTDLFPHPQEFLQWLKDRNLKITMNLHPASGCKVFEDAYRDFAAYMGIDPETKQQIKFDITDEKFIHGYFTYLHHPHEAAGVDFWWIDWQQGKKTKGPGLDPLWARNHYHSCDIARDGKRPLILSRFAGTGSHRYPLGFSGDSAQNWECLAFQPYFTANASNIGYTWWSHDIGGHHAGYRDDELYLRWVQYGVFSPVMRLHSTSNEFMGKEPWKYRASVRDNAVKALKLRHRLIPYLYSMNRRTEKEGRALCEPLYYRLPDDERAYRYPNEYFFGSELLACPITQPADKKTNLAGVKVFLPKGRYTDLFTDRIYEGDTETELFRDEDAIPVLAKEGAIIPLDCNDTTNDCSNPENMELLVFRGNSSFTLYEDDGETMRYKDGAFAETVFTIKEADDTIRLEIAPAAGDISVLPESRNYTVVFRDVTDAQTVTVNKNGRKTQAVRMDDPKYLTLAIKRVAPSDNIVIELLQPTIRHSPSKRELKIDLISRIQGNNAKKKLYEKCIEDDADTIPATMKAPFRELETLY